MVKKRVERATMRERKTIKTAVPVTILSRSSDRKQHILSNLSGRAQKAGINRRSGNKEREEKEHKRHDAKPSVVNLQFWVDGANEQLFAATQVPKKRGRRLLHERLLLQESL
jgi:hypothetical protein